MQYGCFCCPRPGIAHRASGNASVCCTGKWRKLTCEWHRAVGTSPMTELPVPVVTGWQEFAAAWHVQPDHILRVRFLPTCCRHT